MHVGVERDEGRQHEPDIERIEEPIGLGGCDRATDDLTGALPLIEP